MRGLVPLIILTVEKVTMFISSLSNLQATLLLAPCILLGIGLVSQAKAWSTTGMSVNRSLADQTELVHRPAETHLRSRHKWQLIIDML